MAFPSIGDSNTTLTASGTTHTVNLPPNIVAGDLLIIVCFTGTATLTFPAGWNQIYLNTSSFHTEGQYKIADGTEGATISVASSASVAGSWIAYRIDAATWHGTTPPEAPAVATGTSANADPPAVTPSWGSDDNLYIATANHVGTSTATYPSGYTLGQLSVIGTSAIYAAGKQATSGSEDPAAFVFGASNVWRAETIAVRPALPKGFPFKPDYMTPLLVR